jgi:hypothetical protein
MNLKHWDKLSRRQRVISQSMTAYKLALCGVKPFQYLSWDSFECKFCNGTGSVEAWTGGGEIHTWACPDCKGGQVSQEAYTRQLDCLGAFKAALRGSQ